MASQQCLNTLISHIDAGLTRVLRSQVEFLSFDSARFEPSTSGNG